jgi:hypothetical protein
MLKNQIIIKFAKKDFSTFFPSQKICSLGKKNAILGGRNFNISTYNNNNNNNNKPNNYLL